MEWHKVKDNILGLLDFLISSELIIDKEGVIDFIENPENYTEVFNLYAREIMGVEGVEIND